MKRRVNGDHFNRHGRSFIPVERGTRSRTVTEWQRAFAAESLISAIFSGGVGQSAAWNELCTSCFATARDSSNRIIRRRQGSTP